MPAAFQVGAPFGANVGGANPAFFPFSADVQFDSWLTAGITEGDSAGALSSIGIDWDSWTESATLDVPDGAVFWMDPASAPEGDSIVAQLTVPVGDSGQMTAGAQGRSAGGADAQDWSQDNIVWTYP